MTTAIKRRRGTTAQHSTFTGLEGELTIDTTKDTVVVHDGATAGGFPLLREDLSNNTNIASTSTTQTLTNKTLTSPVINTATISGGTINNASVGATTPNTGAFTTLSASGAFSANGGATLGDASGDALTINSSAVSIPNGLNFDSNTLVIDATNNAVGIGTSSPATQLQVSSATGTASPTPTEIRIATTSNAADWSTTLPWGRLSFYSADGSAGGAKIVSSIDTIAASASGGTGVLTFNIADASTGVLTERMKLDYAGNLGLGVTPSAWGSGYKALEISGGSLATTGSTDVRLYQNVFYSGTANTYKTTAAATLYYQGAGQHQWFNAPSGTAGTTATFTQAMTLDASGDLSLGNTNSDYRLNVFSGTNNSTIARFTGAQSRGLLISTFSQNGNDNGANLNAVGDGTNAALSFSTLSTERMRIDSSGNLLVGTTTIDPTFNRVNGLQITPAGSIFARANNPWDLGRSVTSGIHISFYTDNGSARVTAGNISSNGSTTTYATSSDYRMKTDVQPMTNALNKVMQLNPVTYKWVNGLGGTKENGEGFIAHELQEVVPDCVTGEKDAVDADGKPVYQGIDVSFLVATLTASIQELKAIVDAQAERIAVLESK